MVLDGTIKDLATLQDVPYDRHICMRPYMSLYSSIYTQHISTLMMVLNIYIWIGGCVRGAESGTI